MGVAAALQLYAGQGGALFLGFDHAEGFAVDVEQIVGKAKTVVQVEFADGHARGVTTSGVDVNVCHIADVPTGCN